MENQMDWTEIKITVNADDVDRAGDIAHMAVPYGIYIEDYRTLEEEAWQIARIDLIDEDLLAKDRTKGIVHIYISPEGLYNADANGDGKINSIDALIVLNISVGYIVL